MSLGKKKKKKMTDPNLLLESSETVLLNQDQILMNINEGAQILTKLEIMDQMNSQEISRYLLLNDGLELQQSKISGKTVVTATDVICIIEGDIGAGNIVSVVDPKQVITKLDIPLTNGTYGFEKYKDIISNNPIFHKEICLPYECKPLDPKLVEMVSPTSKIVLEEMSQLAINGKTSAVQTYLDVKSARHLSSRIGIVIMVLGAVGKIL
jgi:hypothetical protein